MANAMEIILLERIDNLGHMGEVVKVRTGYARNYLLPQKKALRATKDNLAYFETQRAALEKLNAEKRSASEKDAKKIDGLKVTIIRLAAEGGQLFGSVTARDIAEAVAEQGKMPVGRSQVQLNEGLKTIGLFPVVVALHPEVKVTVTVNVARTEEEAKIQAKTGKPVLDSGSAATAADAKAVAAEENAKAAFLDDSALKAEAAESDEDAAPKKAKKSKKAAAE